jgi:hypothetical protein
MIYYSAALLVALERDIDVVLAQQFCESAILLLQILGNYKKYIFEVSFSDMMFIPYVVKIGQLVHE